MCGHFTDAEAITAENGTINPSNSDSELNYCLDEDTYDIVFLTDRWLGEGAAGGGPVPHDKRQALWDFYCGENGPDPRPEFCSDTDGGVVPEDFEVATLGLAHAVPASASLDCSTPLYLSEAANAGSLDGTQPAGLRDERFARASALASTLRSYHYRYDANGAWTLYRRGTLVMANWLGLQGHMYDVLGLEPGGQAEQDYLEGLGRAIYPACDQAVPSGCFSATEELDSELAVARGVMQDLRQVFDIPGWEGVSQTIEQTLWFMGVLAGGIPENTFSVAIPVAHMGEEGDPWFDSGPGASPATVYANSRVLGPLPPDGNYELTPVLDSETKLEDVSLMGHVVPVTSGWFGGRPASPGTANWWLTETMTRMSQYQTGYYLVQASNSEIRFSPGFDRSLNLGTWLGHFLRGLDWLSCQGGSDQAEALNMTGNYVTSAEAVEFLPEYYYYDCDSSGDPDSCTLATGTSEFGDWYRRDVCVDRGNPVLLEMDVRHRNESNETVWSQQLYVLDHVWRNADLDNAPDELVERVNPVRNQLSPAPEADVWNDFCARDFTGNGFLHTSCLWTRNINVSQGGPPVGGHLVAARRLRPATCPKEERVQLFVNHRVWDDCEAGEVVARVLALSCLEGGSVSLQVQPPPAIATIADIESLEQWLVMAENATVETLDVLALQKVPKRVVHDFAAGAVGTGVLGQGQHGQLLLELRQDLEAMHGAWSDFTDALAQLRVAISRTRTGLEGVELASRATQLQLERERLELDRQAAMAAVDQMLGTAQTVIGAGQAAAACFEILHPTASFSAALTVAEGLATIERAQINMETAEAAGRLVGEQEQIAGEQAGVNRQMLLLDLTDDASSAYTAMRTSLSGMRMATADALSHIIGIEQNSGHATREAAKVAGADFLVIDGDTVAMPVNTVQNRLYSVHRERYGRALDQAKRAAYLARLAIEQRIGVRLNELNEDIGPLPPPSTWADDLCSLQGIDYAALRDATLGGASNSGTTDETDAEEADFIQNFADQYIGDYVARLREFVELYNVARPFRESDDTMIL